MDSHEAIRSQYHAALEMLEKAVIACPEQLWNSTEDRNRFWHVAYHTTFFTHLYLQDSREQFVPWEKHRQNLVGLGNSGESSEPYSKDEVLAYIAFCRRVVDEKVPALDLSAASGFHWLPFDKLELQFYNIRHLQHHTGELMERLGTRAGVDVGWVIAGPNRGGRQ
jgi:hypothetical protein